jgi:hypothetical protein
MTVIDVLNQAKENVHKRNIKTFKEDLVDLIKKHNIHKPTGISEYILADYIADNISAYNRLHCQVNLEKRISGKIV